MTCTDHTDSDIHRQSSEINIRPAMMVSKKVPRKETPSLAVSSPQCLRQDVVQQRRRPSCASEILLTWFINHGFKHHPIRTHEAYPQPPPMRNLRLPGRVSSGLGGGLKLKPPGGIGWPSGSTSPQLYTLCGAMQGRC